MIEKTVLDRFYDEDDLAVLKRIMLYRRKRKESQVRNILWRILGDTISAFFLQVAAMMNCWILCRKLEQDAQQHAAYISQKIKDCGLENHAFYFYLLPLNDAETERKR